jgi:hypothetical protein
MAHIRPIEVNPDEMAAYYVNRLFDQMENGKKLRDSRSGQVFEGWAVSATNGSVDFQVGGRVEGD